MADASPRYAVYFAPRQGSAHDAFGSRWLGRDARSGSPLPQPTSPELDAARLAGLTAAARRYGLHATLKPPFRLISPEALPQLDCRLHALAAAQSAFSFRVAVASLGDFLAWRPVDQHDRIAAIAAACVTELDDLRRLPPVEEIERRRAVGLSTRQEALLLRWGYPYLFDEYRCHITLTDRLTGADAAHVRACLESSCRGFIEEPLVFDALALFVEEDAADGFRHIRSYGFDGSVWSLPEDGAP